MAHPEEPNGLPKVDRANRNQAASRKALTAALPVDHLRIRDERGDDFGVDVSMEAILNDRATNFRAHVQLKSCELEETLSDGTITYRVPTHNILYLLNSSALPVYILYVVRTDELYLAFARDEAERLNAGDAKWQDQGTVTLRFTSKLDTKAWTFLWERILREGELKKRFLNTIQSAASRNTSTRMDALPAAGEIISSTDAAHLLRTTAFLAIDLGFAAKVCDVFGLIQGSDKSDPLIRLSVGYAETSRGHYYDAIGHLMQARLGRDALNESQRQTLELLLNYCEFATGRVSQDQYLAAEARLVQAADTVVRWDHELRAAHFALLAPTNDPAKRSSHRKTLLDVVSRAEASGRLDATRAIRYKLAALQVEGDRLCSELLEAIYGRKARLQTRIPGMEVGATDLQKWMTQISALMRTMEQLRSSAATEGRSVFADVEVALAGIHIQQYFSFTMLGHSHPEQPPVPAMPVSLLDALNRSLDHAIRIYQEDDNFEDLSRAELAKADLAALTGDGIKSAEIANGVLRRAIALDQKWAEKRATAHVNGRWLLDDAIQDLQQRAAVDQDEQMAKMSESEVQQHAQQTLRLLKLPNDRYENVLKDINALHIVSTERLRFCLHLIVKQDLAHAQSNETVYATDPERVAGCDKFHYESLIPSHDVNALLSAFKSSYCATCSMRQPKRDQSA